MQELTVDLDGLVLRATLLGDSAPLTREALAAHLPLERPAIHAMWSGPLIIAENVDLGDLPVENPTTYLAAGDLVYHPRHREIALAYAATQFKEPVGPVYVTLLGRATGDLGRLAEIGRRLQYTGARRLLLS